MSARRRAQQPPMSMLFPLILLGVVGAGVGVYYGYPALVAIPVAVALAGWTEPHPIFTGPKDPQYGNPTPSGPMELAARTRFAVLSELKWRLLLPNAHWLPGRSEERRAGE